MSMIYTRPYKVQNWILIEKIAGKGRNSVVLDALKNAGGREIKWPAKTFPDFILTYRKKGYFDHLPEKYPYIVDTNLLLRAAVEHVKQTVGSTSYLSGAFSIPAHYLNRKVTHVKDFGSLFNEILYLEDDIGLSQIFRLGEDCNSGRNTDVKTYVSVGPVPRKLLTRMAQRVITIGDEPSNDITLGDLTEEQIIEALNKYFSKE